MNQSPSCPSQHQRERRPRIAMDAVPSRLAAMLPARPPAALHKPGPARGRFAHSDCLDPSIMKRILNLLLLAAVLGLGACSSLPGATNTDPLFVNLISDEPHRATMGIGFGKNQFDRGHPLTVFLNDRAVVIGAKANAGKFPEQQKMLSELVARGATVLVCPMCMKHYGVETADLLPGIQVGKPELTGAALFEDDTKTMSW